MLIATKLPCHTNLHSTIVSSWLLSQTSFISSVSFVFLSSQYIPVSEVPGGVGVSFACWLCAGVQVWVPVALLAFPSQCLRFLQISGAGKRMIKNSVHPQSTPVSWDTQFVEVSPPPLCFRRSHSSLCLWHSRQTSSASCSSLSSGCSLLPAPTYGCSMYGTQVSSRCLALPPFVFVQTTSVKRKRICNLPTDPLAGWKAP